MSKKQEKVADVVEAPRENPLKRFTKYVEESRVELRKITWPTLQTTKKVSIAVLGFVAVMAVLLGLVDLGLSSLIKALLS
ncbi:MAG: preprotein translocase subunit SecE [Desulfovibrio sp.]|nr:preprotein translocase subunit SecE [Desulfovibrio sp.]